MEKPTKEELEQIWDDWNVGNIPCPPLPQDLKLIQIGYEEGRLSAFKEMRDWAKKGYIENEKELNLSEDTNVKHFRIGMITALEKVIEFAEAQIKKVGKLEK